MTDLFSHYLRAGRLIRLQDRLITIPPNSDDRKYHDSRYAVVVSADSRNEDPDWPFVLVVPTTTNAQFQSDICVPLEKHVDGVEKDCIARIPLVQPLYKDQLNDTNADIGGKVSEGALAAIMASVVDYLAFDTIDPDPDDVVIEMPRREVVFTPNMMPRRQA